MARETLLDSLARARRVVDDRFGVVRHAIVHEIGPSDPPLFFATAALAATRAFSDTQANVLNGGAGRDRNEALLGALGEAMERYAIGLYREEELVRGSYDDLAPVAVDPRRLVFHSDVQYEWEGFPYAAFDAARPMSWVAGVSLLDGSRRLVPAARVFTPYHPPRATERIMQSSSTGAACHVDRDRAVLAGLYECIERDAVMIAWLNRLALPEIDSVTAAEPAVAALVDRFRRRGLTARLLDATTDLEIPTVVCVLAGPPETIPALAVGAATRRTAAAAAEKALIESAHTFFWIRSRCRPDGLPAFRADYADITSLDLHSLLYGDPRMRANLDFLCGEVPAAVQEFKARARAAGESSRGGTHAELERCVDVLRRRGHDAIAVDVTPADVAEMGFVVTRVVVLDLHPLWGGHRVRCLGGRRLREVPPRLGYPARAEDELNTDPHPMP